MHPPLRGEAETKQKISKAMSGENSPMHGKTGENHPKSKKVFVYSNSTSTILEHEFVSYSEAAKHFKCSIITVSRYLDSGRLFKKQWVFV